MKYVFIDLDETLIRTDLFVESIIKFLKVNPLNFFRLTYWMLSGRSVAKARLARKVKIDIAYLPYETELIDYLRTRKDQGDHLILATASHWTHAKRIADYLGIFDGIIASDAKNNLKGSRKLRKILDYVGNEKFGYAGDSSADRPIWNEASENIHVNSSSAECARSVRAGKCGKRISSKPVMAHAFIKGMRIHQWAKNVLVFAPLLTSHGYLDTSAVGSAVLAFVAFCLCASGVYFLNDLLDLDSDRRHARKRTRPLASGDLSLRAGIIGAILLPSAAFAISVLLMPLPFLAVLAGYFILTNAYSFYLKRVSTADVMTLAVLYTVRVIAGAVAIGVDLSSWLLAFSMFLFVSLAFLKRYIELAAIDPESGGAPGRGYSWVDGETMFSLGIANATASVLVLALFISSPEVADVYPNPKVLWVLCLLMLYWTNRIWVGARRGKIHDDPIVFAIKDRVSRLVGVAFMVVVITARYAEI